MNGSQRREQIMEAGLRLWRNDPASVSARRIGSELGITHVTVLHHYGTASGLHDALAAEAVARQDEVIVPQLIVARHPATDALTAAERAAMLGRSLTVSSS